MLRLPLKSNSIQVLLTGGSETPQEYELREMSAAQRDSYLMAISERMSLGPDGRPVSVRNYDGMQADLVSRCLYPKSGKETVTVELIQSWPASTVTQLFTTCQELNQLGQKSETIVEASKNA